MRDWREILDEDLRTKIAFAGGVLGAVGAFVFNWFQPLVYDPTIFNRYLWFNIGVFFAVSGASYAATNCAIKLMTRPNKVWRAVAAFLITAVCISAFNYATTLPLTNDFAILKYTHIAIGVDNLERGITALLGE